MDHFCESIWPEKSLAVGKNGNEASAIIFLTPYIKGVRVVFSSGLAL